MSAKVTVKATSQAKDILETFLISFSKEAAEEIKVEAQNLCPVDTGTLKASIRVDEDGESYSIGSPLDYAIYVEMGTIHMSPQSFLRKAFYNVVSKKL